MQDKDTAVMAYLDGELEPAAQADFEARLSKDAELRQALQREQTLRAKLAAAFDPVLAEPVPDKLLALLAEPAPTAQVIELAPRRPQGGLAERLRRWALPEWAGMAASLLLGVLLGVAGWQARQPSAELSLVRNTAGQLEAHGQLAQALEHTLAGEAGSAAGVQAGLSFVAQDGRYCRSFTLPGPSASAGLACRGPAAWELQALAAAKPTAKGTEYRMAASELPPSVLQLIDEMRAGEMLSAAEERAARAKGWRR